MLADENGLVAPALAQIGSENGFQSLGFDGVGDVVEIDEGATLMQLSADPVETAIMAGHPGIISRVTVDGHEVVKEGRHILR